MESATWCRTPPAAASAGRRLRSEVSKNSSTALSSNEGELARSITTCAPAMASLSPSPVMVLTPVLGEATTTSWLPWRRMATVFEPIRPVPPMTTIFMVYAPTHAKLLRTDFEGLDRRERVDNFICCHNGIGVVREIDLESGVHLFVGVIRRRVFDHRDLVAELSGEAYRCLHTGVRYESDDDELMNAVLLEL